MTQVRTFSGYFFTILLTAGCGGDQRAEKPTPPPAKPAEKPTAAKPGPAEAEVKQAAVVAACTADPSWLTATVGPAEVGGDTPIDQETNCQFQQFAWQWFLVLMQPTSPGGERFFEGYPSWLGSSVKNQCQLAQPPTGRAAFSRTLFMRDQKDERAADTAVILPTETGQATGGLLYDQSKNIVLYNVRYSPNECQPNASGYQPNTVEVKTSWRVVTGVPGFDPSTYYTFQAEVAGFKGPQTLALVGFHVVVNTANHPEFVWATFEHKANAPDCTSPAAPPTGGWSFTSADAAACLARSGLDGCGQYDFNAEVSGSSGDPVSLTGTPDEVCRVYPDGTDPGATTGGNDNDTNRANIDQLNAQLVGPGGLLTSLEPGNPLAVLQNYVMVGSLWTLGGAASGGADVQRGSLELANLTMETNFQQQGRNCFTCHNYAPNSPGDPTAAFAVSHLYGTLNPKPPPAPKLPKPPK